MTTVEIISIVSIITETVAIVISAFVVFFFLIQKKETPIDKNIFKMVCLTIAVLFCDILCYWYKGSPPSWPISWFGSAISSCTW